MSESKSIKPGQRITTAKSESLSLGTIQDMKLAEDLYAADRESEAIAILDRMLGLPQDIDSAVERLRFLLSNSNMIDFDAQMQDVAQDGIRFSIEPKLSGAYARELMLLRSKCFSALLDRTPECDDPQIQKQALENAEIVRHVFFRDPDLLTLAAQVFFFQKNTTHATELLEEALKLDPNHQVAKGTLKMISYAKQNKSYPSMTEQAISIMYDISNKKRDLRDISAALELLRQSLDIYEHEPRAWAAVAWVYAYANNKASSVEAIRKAQEYGPEDELVHQITMAIDNLGWFDEHEAATPKPKKTWWKFGK